MMSYTELHAKIRRLKNQLAEEKLRRAQAEALAEIRNQRAAYFLTKYCTKMRPASQ